MAASGHQARSTAVGAVGTAEITARRLPAARGRVRIEGPIRWDQWWVEPALVVLVLGSFIVYSTWAAFQNAHYYAAPYLSPFYSPCLSTDCQHVTVPLFGKLPALPIIGVVSPAFLILWGPGLFRLTCYYYRKAYYRSFWGAPPACAVTDVRPGYTGETRFPLIFQNLHRYTLYGALILLVFLWWEGLAAFFKDGRFGIGVGTVVMVINAALLTGYTFGCHSWRHLIGGRMDCFTCDSAASTRYRLWKGSTWLNTRHMAFAWLSLVWVAFTDFYIYLVSSGTIRDLNTW